MKRFQPTPSEPFCKVTKRELDWAPILSDRAFKIYVVLRFYSWRTTGPNCGSVYVTTRRLVELTGISLGGISPALTELEDCGLIVRTGGRNRFEASVIRVCAQEFLPTLLPKNVSLPLSENGEGKVNVDTTTTNGGGTGYEECKETMRSAGGSLAIRIRGSSDQPADRYRSAYGSLPAPKPKKRKILCGASDEYRETSEENDNSNGGSQHSSLTEILKQSKHTKKDTVREKRYSSTKGVLQELGQRLRDKTKPNHIEEKRQK